MKGDVKNSDENKKEPKDIHFDFSQIKLFAEDEFKKPIEEDKNEYFLLSSFKR